MTYSSANKTTFPIKKVQRHITRCKRPHLLRPNSAYAELLLHGERYILSPVLFLFILIHPRPYRSASSAFNRDTLIHPGYSPPRSPVKMPRITVSSRNVDVPVRVSTRHHVSGKPHLITNFLWDSLTVSMDTGIYEPFARALAIQAYTLRAIDSACAR